jgi:hypothetical protein
VTTPLAQVIAVAVAVSGGLLLVAGWQKLASPGTTVSEFELGRAGSIVLAVSELVAGIAILTIGGRAMAAVVFVAYGSFTCVTVWKLLSPTASRTCACFGARSAEVTWLHVGVDALACIAGALGWFFGAPTLLSLWSHGWLSGLTVSVGVSASVLGLYGLLTARAGFAALSPDALTQGRRASRA